MHVYDLIEQLKSLQKHEPNANVTVDNIEIEECNIEDEDIVIKLRDDER